MKEAKKLHNNYSFVLILDHFGNMSDPFILNRALCVINAGLNFTRFGFVFISLITEVFFTQQKDARLASFDM